LRLTCATGKLPPKPSQSLTILTTQLIASSATPAPKKWASPTPSSSKSPTGPRWVWDHDPEVYAYEHYAKNIETMKKGIGFDESGIPPNYPPGYKWEEWSIDTIMDAMRKGIPVELGPGNWD
jgi:hypothetical protein